MLTVYRRHRSNCENRTNRYYRKCRCACWCEGTVEGEYRRESLKTSSWQRATALVRANEDGKKTEQPNPLTIHEAISKFLLDAERGRKLAPATLKKYKVLTAQLQAFAERNGIALLKEITVDFTRDFRASWKDGPISSLKKLERLRAFFRHYVLSGHLTSNPAAVVARPILQNVPTLPLSAKEINKALEKATDSRWHALIQVLRWSGLRIGDAMKLTPEKLEGNRLFLRTAKTGTPVYVPLPPFVIEELQKLPLHGGYYFWNRAGESKIETATGNARRAFRKIFTAAGVTDAHPHRLRDSFAVDLLENGVSIESVAILLGHSSIRVTEKHYSPWIKARQQRLEEIVSATWKAYRLVRVK